MSDSPIYCSACGTRHEAGSLFCTKCGARLGVAASSSESSPSTPRTILEKLSDAVINEGINQLAPLVVAKIIAIYTTIAGIVQSILLTLLNTGRSIPQWFLLTWPLTFAVAAIMVVNHRVTKGSLSIVPIGAFILLAATWLGTAISGVRYIENYYTAPQGAIAIVIYLLQRMFVIYGGGAFVISVLSGILIGVLLTRVGPQSPAEPTADTPANV